MTPATHPPLITKRDVVLACLPAFFLLVPIFVNNYLDSKAAPLAQDVLLNKAELAQIRQQLQRIENAQGAFATKEDVQLLREQLKTFEARFNRRFSWMVTE